MVVRIVRLFLSYLLYEFSTRKKEVVIFSGYNGLKYNFNSKYLFEYFLTKSDYKSYFIINDDSLREHLNSTIGNFFITTKKQQDLKLIFTAFTWITSGGLPIRIPYVNRNRVVVNLWHGIPFKGIGVANGENSVIQNILIRFIYSKYDLISATSELFQQIMTRSFAVKQNQVKILGQAWNDQLWKLNNRMKILQSLYGPDLPTVDKVFLYAPTWRNKHKTTFFPFADFSLNRLEDFLEKHKMIICLRTHQLDINNATNYTACKRILLLNEDKVADIMAILNIFDGLISDYSGIILDFLLLDRPIILLPYDESEYISERNVNFDFELFEFINSPKDMNCFLNLLLEVTNNFSVPNKQRRFKDVVHYYTDNRSCERHYNEISKLIKFKYRLS